MKEGEQGTNKKTLYLLFIVALFSMSSLPGIITTKASRPIPFEIVCTLVNMPDPKVKYYPSEDHYNVIIVEST